MASGVSGFDPSTLTPPSSVSGFDPSTLTAPGVAFDTKPAEMRSGASDGYDKNWWDTHVENLGQHAYNFFARHGHEDIGTAIKHAIVKGSPHNNTEAALMAVTSALPGIGKVGGAALEESAPMLSKTLSALNAPGFKGAAARVAATTATGAITGGITGEGTIEGATKGATMSALGEVPEAGRAVATKAGDAIVDKPGLIKSATDAAEKATADNAKDLGKLAPKATEESLKEGRAVQAAQDQQAEANLKARSKQYTDSKAAIDQGQGVPPKTMQEAEDRIGMAREDLAHQSAGGIRDRIIHQATGRTPEQTEAAIHAAPEISEDGVAVPGPEFVARRRAFLDSAYGPETRMQDELGRQYETVLGPHLQKPVNDTSVISNAVGEQEKYAADNSVTYSAPVRKLLEDTKKLSVGADPLAQFYPPEELQGLTARQRANLEKATHEMFGRADKVAPKTTYAGSEIAGRGAAPAEAQVAAGPTVEQLRGIRSRASELVSRSTDPHDRAAAAAVRSSIESALEGAGIPGVKELNSKYATFKKLFGSDYFRAIANAKDPIDAAPHIFNEPQRSSLLLNNASPEQLQNLRNLYGDWINRDGGKVVDPKTQKPVLEKLFHGTKLADPKSWIHLPDKLVKAQDLLADDPEFGRQVEQIATTERRKAATQIVQSLMSAAKELGPAGQPLIKQAGTAKTPEEAASILIQGFTGMKPEDAVAAMAPLMRTPEQAGAEAARTAPQAARQQLQAFQPQDPNQAAIASIQAGNTPAKGVGNHMMAYAKRIWPLMAAFSGFDLAMGHSPSTWHLGMAGIGLAMKGSEVMKNAFVNSLKDPVKAEAFWAAAQKPKEPRSMGVLARGVVRMLGSAAVNIYGGNAPSENTDPDLVVEPPAPPKLEEQPLPALAKAWQQASSFHDDAQMNKIARIISDKAKKGEWAALDSKTKASLAPILRKMMAPNSEDSRASS